MPDIRNLYQKLIVDHYRNPRNFRDLPDANRRAEGHNSLCGDKLSVHLIIKNHIFEEISFNGSGCAIFVASASMMTEVTKGKSVQEALAISKRFRQIVGDSSESTPEGIEMGDLKAFSGVRGYPARVKCALLPWETLLAALERQSPVASRQSTVQ